MLLYKYRSLDATSAEFTLKTLSDREAYFSEPNSFNDPFEFRPKLSLDASKEEFANYLEALYKRKLPWLNRQDRKKNIAATMRDKSRNHQSAEFAEVISSAMEEFLQKCGVYCLSSDPTSILMWSHYADCHRGICIGFDGADTNEFFGRAQQVIYQEDYPVANIIKDSRRTYQDKTILTKASFWAYEKEWRIIEHERGSGVYNFDKNDLKQVIFGAKARDRDIETVLRVIDENMMSPEIYKARLHENKYALALDRIRT